MPKPRSIAELLAVAASDEDDAEKKNSSIAADVEVVKLRDAFTAYRARHRFAVGDPIRQKPASKMYRGFGQNDVTIVVEVLAEPIEIQRAREERTFDLAVGSIEGDGTFCIYYVDSRRFEPVPEEFLKLLKLETLR